jgi:hypothetical protein
LSLAIDVFSFLKIRQTSLPNNPVSVYLHHKRAGEKSNRNVFPPQAGGGS